MWRFLLSALILAFGQQQGPLTRPPGVVAGDHRGASMAEGGAADSCQVCHGIAGAGGLAGQSENLCISCHSETKAKLLKRYRHVEVTSAEYPSISCEGCHKLHQAPGESLLANNETELCQGCHPETGDHVSHPVMDPSGLGQPIKGNDGRSLTCASHCHDMHGTDFRFICRLEPGRDLCISCHGEFE